ncbi:hypothetical protein A1O1_04936 [Capronia coronata CBS 617.96]|uniref:Mediator of RNA polymerase II transcription subunit 4 n=1 Tax=Capronia coronata CBS 617.96 TaxID=1182541 RepID=W9Z0F3_9EURO|nr:uncharacterized protein A1O1_04936 [Capronia coronata CBS 617.96]EXJ88009.1 hypothetical protein A1O1_04936 [Capronia coronata CBS 617.96]
MDSVVLNPLNSLETHLNALITSLTQTNTFSNAPQITKDLLSDDYNLTESLNILQRHQQNYARTLDLRAEVASLQEQLKDTIKKCVALRQEIGQIHPSIVDSVDSDDEEEQEIGAKVAEVDYQTLLAFAARIGRHNAAAAREAEAEAIRRKVAARNNTTSATATTNGVSDSGAQTAGHENATAETEAELERIHNTIALTRAQMGMAFPDANMLRIGALGQLQLFQERQQHASNGDEEVQAAVEREVERMVRETEDVAEAEVEHGAEEEGDDDDNNLGSWPSPEMSRRSIGGTGTGMPAAVQQSASQPSQSRAAVPAASAPAPKRKLDLDFPSSDDDDDED